MENISLKRLIKGTVLGTILSFSGFATSVSATPLSPPKGISATTLSTTAKGKNSVTLVDMRVGNLKIGMPLHQVTNSFGNPEQKTTVHGIGDPEWIYKREGIDVSGNPIWRITVTRPFKGSTPRGIRIGSTQTEVLHDYVGIQAHKYPGYTYLVEYSPNHKYQLMFQVKAGVVRSITVTNDVTIK